MEKKPPKQPEIVLDPRKMRMVDAWYWAEFSQIKLGSGVFTTDGHEYEIGPFSVTTLISVLSRGRRWGGPRYAC